MTTPIIAVFAGGTSAEREVSTGSGAACAAALSRSFTTRLFSVTADALPVGYDPSVHVVFSTLHGTFGEDGGMQRLLDGVGGAYAGCGASASALTMDKSLTKSTVSARGVPVVQGIEFGAETKPSADEVNRRLGGRVVRAETAVFVGLTVLQYALGDLAVEPRTTKTSVLPLISLPTTSFTV